MVEGASLSLMGCPFWEEGKKSVVNILPFPLILDTRVPPRRCLGFIQRWPKIPENASHVADLHSHANLTVYHMSPLVMSPQRRCVTKLTEILFY